MAKESSAAVYVLFEYISSFSGKFRSISDIHPTLYIQSVLCVELTMV